MNKDLPFLIECRDDISHYFEPIAAFNVECVAQKYMNDCKKTNPRYTYRLKTLKD